MPNTLHNRTLTRIPRTISLVLLSLLAMGAAVFNQWRDGDAESGNPRRLDAAIPRLLLTAHVSLEELLSGDPTVDADRDVFSRLDSALDLIRKQFGVETLGSDPRERTLRLAARDLEADLERLRALSAARLDARAEPSGADFALESQHDALSDRVLEKCNSISDHLAEIQNDRQARLRMISTGTILFLLLLSSILALIAAREYRLIAEINNSLDAAVARRTADLECANERLQAELAEGARTERALSESSERYQLIATATNDTIWDWDLTKDSLWLSEAITTQFGYTPDQVGTDSAWWIGRIDPEDRNGVLSDVAHVLETGGDSWSRQFRFARADGSYAHVFDRGFVLRNGDGEPVRLLGAMLDISERVRAEEALVVSEQQYRQLFKDNPNPMWVCDAETLAFCAVNAAAVRHYGYSEAEFRAMTLADIRPREDVPALRSAVAHTGGDTLKPTGAWRHVKKDGSIMDVEVMAHCTTFAGKPAIVSLLSDVTERKALEEQLRQSQKMEAIGLLAGGVAHDFNNLLTVISGYSEFALRRLGPDDTLRSFLEEIKGAGERAAGLTRQLLAFSRKQVMQPRVLDLNDVVAELQSMLRRLIGEDVDLVTNGSPKLGCVMADPGQIGQVIVNLAVNARDAMPHGGRLEIRTSNRVLDEAYAHSHVDIRPGSYVVLEMTDTGTGMDEVTRARIFEPFFTTKEAGKGTGLGLSTVYGIVCQSSGFIDVSSTPGRGTTFSVFLPRVDHGPGGCGEQQDAEASVEKGGETILLVEDEDGVRVLAREALRQNGYQVYDARSGAEALGLIQQHAGRVDLLLTDVVMPGMNGRQLVERVLGTHPDIQVLYMSGYPEDSVVRNGLAADRIDLLAKPFGPESLCRRVRQVLSARPANVALPVLTA